MASEEEPRPAPGRRGRVDQVGDELAALRRDVDEATGLARQHGNLLAEVLPRLDELTTAVTALVAADEQRERESKAEKQARREAGLLDEPPAPWTWLILDKQTAQAAWSTLGRWVTSTLCGQYQLTLAKLPGCWPAHPPAVAELSGLRAAHIAAVARGAHPSALLSWQRELPAELDRLAVAIDPRRCPPGLHLVEELPPERERQRVGCQPCAPEMWQPLLARVAAADVATRWEAPSANA